MNHWFRLPVWGKVVGAILGFLVAKTPVGVIIGAILGHQFDRGLRRNGRIDDSDESIHTSGSVQHHVFYTTFAVMGHIAKSDGRVSEDEIKAATRIMQLWALNPQQTRLAIQYFKEGKKKGFPLTQVLLQFAREAGDDRAVLLSFAKAQMRIMMADHQIHPASRQRTWDVCHSLGITRVEMASIETELRGSSHRGGMTLQLAYQALGVSSSANNDGVKTAYRRMMNRYHPDKLIADSLSAGDLAEARTALDRCREAYDVIKAARGMR